MDIGICWVIRSEICNYCKWCCDSCWVSGVDSIGKISYWVFGRFEKFVLVVWNWIDLVSFGW